MQFYKIRVELTASEINEEGGKNRRDSANRISAKTTEFNGNSTKCFCFLADKSDDSATIGMISADVTDPAKRSNDFAKSIGLSVEATFSEEITLYNIQNLLGTANRMSFIEDDDDIMEHFGLDKLGRRRGLLDFGENLVNCKAEKDELFSSAKRLLASETLIPELERIYAGTKSTHPIGHPVHYIVETDDHDTRRELYKALLDALYVNHRLESSRYTFIDFRPGERYSKLAYNTLYKVADGGAVVVRYVAEDDTDESSNASGEREVIENLCEMAKRYRSKVLTVFCLPRECKRMKTQFFENLGTMSFVEIREDFVGGEAARGFLAGLAKEKHIRTDKALFGEIDDERTYLAPELVSMFEQWYDGKLKRTVYPQYKSISAVRGEALKSKPQGCAFDELNDMIGLTEAKSVIKKAINYYKMQKLYEEKGVKRDNPAMHMIFTGNPGTAKTTVARLFARIMRENGLLSRGQLVEVGRGDLVGKYVGWTAQTVKAKFVDATGGVLFIDEAYSLVDDRDGSYGDEAINTIVQEMENHRADVVVIFAGYPNKMEGFIDKNPGLRSRIAFHVPFADYNSDELCKITDMLSRKNGMRLEKAALDKLEKAFDIARTDSDFGNGRYARNVFEQAKMNQASRLLEKSIEDISADDITTITADDIVLPEAKKQETRRIGFC